jgi:caffeoyl-CoA O-methyltransferase
MLKFLSRPIAVLAVFSCQLILSAADPAPSSTELRKEFLEKFQSNALNTTAGDAMMLRILIEARGAKRGVEVGAAFGYGAINMGIGFERTGGQLYSIEIDPARVQTIRQNLQKVALDKTVTVVEGDALKALPALPGEFDFVFIDAVKSDYFKYLKAIEPKLKVGAVVVADNVIRSEKAMQDFLTYVTTSPNYETVIIRSSMEKGDGMSISYKLR